MDWGHTLIDHDRLATSDDLPALLESIQELGRLMEFVLLGMQHSDPADDAEALVFSLLWPMQAAAHRAATLEREQRAAPPADPAPAGPLHVVREGA